MRTPPASSEFLYQFRSRSVHRPIALSEDWNLTMHLTKRILVPAIAAAIAIAASPGATIAHDYALAPMAQSYSGSYPVSVSGTQHGGSFTGCLTLAGSGSATLVIGSQKFPYGTYLVISDTLVATIQAQGYGQNAGLVFIARAARNLKQGVYEEVYGGEDFVSGKLTFGSEGGC
jgi:hypothetical protein